jgi:glycosyltransferase involved in cell wall biosynthesis
MKPARKRILMFGYLPPPYFGPSVSYQALMRSRFATHFDVTFIDLTLVGSIRELEVFQARKLLKLAQFFFAELFYLLTRRFDFCCCPISANRNAFLKDATLLRLAQAFGVSTVLYAHGGGMPRFRQTLSPRLRKLLDSTVQRSAAALVLTRELRADFAGLLPEERILVITHGIEAQPTLPRAERSPGKITILYLGALMKTKGVFDLLEAMALVATRRPQAGLVLAGQWFRPEEEAAAGELIRQHALAQAIQFIGPVEGDAKWRIFQQADVFVFPPYSRSEAFGMVLLEAMQTGLPIVATRGGARDEIVTDGVNGLLVNEQDPGDLAEKLIRLIDDSALRQRMSAANHEKFERVYTYEHYGQRMIDVFEQLAAHRGEATL